MRKGDLVRLNRQFAHMNYFGPGDILPESIGMVLGEHPAGGLSVLIEGRVISMFEYELEVIDEAG